MAKAEKRFYVYVFREGEAVLYVGKGSGSRLKTQERRFGLKGEMLGRYSCEDECFKAERDYITQLLPTENKNVGGAGGRCTASSIVPPKYRGQITEKEIRKAMRESQNEENEIKRVGTRKYAASILLRKLNELNCEKWGLSKVDISRLREVAYG